MEIRVLQYFLAIAREQSIIRAAESLHLSQPTLSTQIKNMEEELGKQLLIRGTKGSRKVTLTEEGMILRKRAEEILDLVKKTENEIILSDNVIIGDVCIGAGETDGVRLLAKAAGKLKKLYPGIHYHISSGNAVFVREQLDKGLIDFGIIFGTPDLTKYEALKLPAKDVWGVLMPKDSPLAKKEFIFPRIPVGAANADIPTVRRWRTPCPVDETQYIGTGYCYDLQSAVQCITSCGRGTGVRNLL